MSYNESTVKGRKAMAKRCQLSTQKILCKYVLPLIFSCVTIHVCVPKKSCVSRVLLVRRWWTSEAGASWSGWSGEFRKAPPANVSVHLCLEFAGSGGIRSCAPILLFRPFGSGGSGAKLCSLLPSRWHLVHGELRDGEYHEDRIGGLANGGLSLCTVEGLAWCSGFRSSSMQVGAATRVKFRVLPFRM
jgi:hypothetical protein